MEQREKIAKRNLRPSFVSLHLDFGPQTANGVHATQASVQESANINDSGGGDGGGGGGGLLAAFCGAFCKDNPLGEQFGMNQTSTAPTTQAGPITSQSKALNCYEKINKFFWID